MNRDSTEVAAAPPATPEPSTPEGWEEVEVQVQGHPITTLAPTAEQDLDVADHGTGIRQFLQHEQNKGSCL